MPAMVILYVLRPSDPLARGILDRVGAHIGWTSPLEWGPDDRVEIPFLSLDQPDALYTVERALDRAAADLDATWPPRPLHRAIPMNTRF